MNRNHQPPLGAGDARARRIQDGERALVTPMVWSLYGRLQRGEIDLERFKALAAKATGIKVGKLALLTGVMSVPGLNVVAGAGLVVYLIHSGASAIRDIAKASESPPFSKARPA